MRSFASIVNVSLLAGLLGYSGVYAQDTIILKNGADIQAKVLEISPGQIKYRRQDNPDGPIYTTGIAEVLLIKYANGTKDVLGQSAPVPPAALPQPAVPGPASPPTIPAPDRLDYHPGLLNRYFINGAGMRYAPSVVRSLMAAHPDALAAYRQGQSLRRWTTITAVSAVVLIGAGATVALLGEGKLDQEHRRDGTTTNSTTDTDGKTGADRRGGHESAIAGLALTGDGVLLGGAAILLNHRTNVQFRRATDRFNGHSQSPTSLRLEPSRRGLGATLIYTF